MHRVSSATGPMVSYARWGSGPPLVLIHGAFSDHESNWAYVKPFLERQFTVYAIARRGRGETDATEGHGLEDEGTDAAAVIRAIGEPCFLLGHSYGGHTALLAAVQVPDRVRKMVLYEPAWPSAIDRNALAPIEAHAEAGEWEKFALTFFCDLLQVPVAEMEALRATEHWPPILADAKPTLGDLRAISRYDFRPERFRGLRMPTLLQIGTESPRDLYVTDALAAVLPDARIEELPGQAHEAMTTAPVLYADRVTRFLLA